MKTPAKSTLGARENSPNTKKQNATNPGKPNNDPDQTPERETREVPKAKPTVKAPSEKNKIGFKK